MNYLRFGSVLDFTDIGMETEHINQRYIRRNRHKDENMSPKKPENEELEKEDLETMGDSGDR